MGLFDNNESTREEVVINAPTESSETRLKKEVNSKLMDKEESSEDITLKDVHEQNKRIIGLLEQLNEGDETEEEEGMKGGMDELL